METRTPLTEWEAKERAGLLALETKEWREKRLIAEDPNTPAAVLERLSREIYAAWSTSDAEYRFILPAEAIAAHPNTPLPTLLLLLRSAEPFTGLGGLHLQNPSPICAAAIRGLCWNPIAALLCLEKPDFWLLLDDEASQMLLRREALPPQSAAMLGRHSDYEVVQATKHHISVTGEIQSLSEGRRALTQFWRTYCSPEESKKRVWERAELYIADLVRWGFIPSWACAGTADFSTTSLVPRHLATASPIKPLRRLLYKAVTRTHMAHNSRFLAFVAILQGTLLLKSSAFINGVSSDWMERLEAVFSLPVSATSYSEKLSPQLLYEYEPGNRSSLELLQHLARDGNRFVRWAAQTRLTDPDFKFTWHDGD